MAKNAVDYVNEQHRVALDSLKQAQERREAVAKEVREAEGAVEDWQAAVDKLKRR